MNRNNSELRSISETINSKGGNHAFMKTGSMGVKKPPNKKSTQI